MTYEEFKKGVKYTDRDIYVPILDQHILKSSFIKNGKYDEKAEEKFLKAVYDKRKYRQLREEAELTILKGIRGLGEQEE